MHDGPSMYQPFLPLHFLIPSYPGKLENAVALPGHIVHYRAWPTELRAVTAYFRAAPVQLQCTLIESTVYFHAAQCHRFLPVAHLCALLGMPRIIGLRLFHFGCFLLILCGLFNICLPGTCSTTGTFVEVLSKSTLRRHDLDGHLHGPWPSIRRSMQGLLCKIPARHLRYSAPPCSSMSLHYVFFQAWYFTPRLQHCFIHGLSQSSFFWNPFDEGTFKDQANDDGTIFVVVYGVCDL